MANAETWALARRLRTDIAAGATRSWRRKRDPR
jgi:hypothetical protein